MSAPPDRSEEAWYKQLQALLAGPYAGRGGQVALSADLNISPRGLSFYLTDSKHRRDPNFEVRARIAKLWEERGLNRLD